MYNYGSGTGKQLELFAEVSENASNNSSISDSNKNVWQYSNARIISGGLDTDINESAFYTVEIENENTQIEAMLDGSITYWKKIGIPVVGDRVRVKQKKDMFYCVIDRPLDPMYDLELNKRYSSESGYTFRFDNTKYNNEDHVNGIVENIIKFFDECKNRKDASVATKP